jgi:predicted methyltransferase
MTKVDTVFAGSIPTIYDSYLGPLIFEPYAQDLASRLSALNPESVLETAAGTGIVTRALLRSLSAGASVVATDLNQPMLGVMFFPDKQKAYREARRVLKPGGHFIFNVWDRIEHNEFADLVTTAVAEMFAGDPPRFLARTPHGYHDKQAVIAEVKSAGFGDVAAETVTRRSVAPRSSRRLLPRNPASQRDRGPGRQSAGGGNRSGRQQDQRTVRKWASGRNDPGARHHGE